MCVRAGMHHAHSACVRCAKGNLCMPALLLPELLQSVNCFLHLRRRFQPPQPPNPLEPAGAALPAHACAFPFAATACCAVLREDVYGQDGHAVCDESPRGRVRKGKCAAPGGRSACMLAGSPAGQLGGRRSRGLAVPACCEPSLRRGTDLRRRPLLATNWSVAAGGRQACPELCARHHAVVWQAAHRRAASAGGRLPPCRHGAPHLPGQADCAAGGWWMSTDLRAVPART